MDNHEMECALLEQLTEAHAHIPLITQFPELRRWAVFYFAYSIRN